MSEAPVAQPPAAVPPAAVAPMKMAMKVPMKVPMGSTPFAGGVKIPMMPGGLAVKMPLPAGAPGSAPRPAVVAVQRPPGAGPVVASGVRPVVVARPASAPASKPVLAKPVAASKPAEAKPKAEKEAKPPKPAKPAKPAPPPSTLKYDDDDDDNMLLGSSAAAPKQPKPNRVPAARPAVRKERKPAVKRARSPVSSSSSSSSESEPEPESGDEEENRPLLEVARRSGLIPDLKILDEIIPLGPPPRPRRNKMPTDLDAKMDVVRSNIKKIELAMQLKDDNKTVSLGTSKVNYIDPRIICAWAQREAVPLDRIFTKMLIKKFPWAAGVEEDFEF